MSGRAHVLVVEDQDEIRAVVVAALESDGYTTTAAADAMQALHALGDRPPDLVVLDVNLPDISGLEVLDAIRARGDTAVILLTSLSAEENMIRGLRRGADDYVTKPFSPGELLARVAAVLRRGSGRGGSEEIVASDLRIDLASREVWVGDRLVETTAKEFDLLAFLARNPGRVYTRHQLLREVWGSSSEYQQSNTVTEHVRRLRAKLAIDDGGPLRTVRGVGYRFDRVRPRGDGHAATRQ